MERLQRTICVHRVIGASHCATKRLSAPVKCSNSCECQVSKLTISVTAEKRMLVVVKNDVIVEYESLMKETTCI